MSDQNEKLIRIVFRIFKHCEDPTEEYIGLLGSHPVVGSWNISGAKTTEFIGKSEWHSEVFIPENVDLEYKLFTFKPVKSLHNNIYMYNRHVKWTPFVCHQEPNTRKIKVETKSIKLEMVYGEPGEHVSEMVSHLSKTGQPIDIHVKTAMIMHTSC
ncbi:uncharacterized protein LOC123527202 [Mercenaria mercenaria]|uniref:uncharacterized protein LOC123527202 n=1 Tax=Mercenaria mercenaria TaxID=6596 RepID=UPI00234F75BA|nr:uncharacterized protein LOC123527202 [Mercenaria mercenaria]